MKNHGCELFHPLQWWLFHPMKHDEKWHPLVMTNIAMEALALIEIDGLPFLKNGWIFNGYVSHNQMVHGIYMGSNGRFNHYKW